MTIERVIKLRYLLVGLLYERSKEKELIKLNGHGIQPQVNQYQWGLIDGINIQLEKKIDIIASIPMGSFPKNSKKFLVKKNLIKSEYGVGYIGFINFYIVRERIRQHLFYKKIKEYIESCDDKVTILVYSLYHPFMKVIKKLKKKYGDKINISLIVPDLVGKYGIRHKDILKRLFYDRYANNQLKMSKYADSYVLLTEQMKEILDIGEKPYVICEGFLPNIDDEKLKDNKVYNKKIVLYTGSLNPVFGIVDLMEQFSHIANDNCELWICGQECWASTIKDYGKKDNRIKYKGFLPKTEILKLQQSASILVNPRKNDGEYTKYSFPSKTLEYMVSGTPVLMYKLDGIPDEYDKFIYYADENCDEPLKVKLEEILSKSPEELEMFGEKAKKFVLENKNNIHQAKKIISMTNLSD